MTKLAIEGTGNNGYFLRDADTGEMLFYLIPHFTVYGHVARVADSGRSQKLARIIADAPETLSVLEELLSCLIIHGGYNENIAKIISRAVELTTNQRKKKA